MSDQSGFSLLDCLNTGGVIVTALATMVLAYFTIILSRETKRLAEITSMPQVVMTLALNDWTLMHADVEVENVGTGTAFDITIEVTPPITEKGAGDVFKPFPLNKISILKPTQKMKCSIGEFHALLNTEFEVVISWQRDLKVSKRENLKYKIKGADYKNMMFIGPRTPEISSANSLKKLEETLKRAFDGLRKLQVDVYTQLDRDERERLIRDRIAKEKGKREV